MRLLAYICLTLTLVLAGCGSTSSGNKSSAPGQGSPAGEVVETNERDAAKAVMLALKQQDMATLATFIHPEKGLLFSPYAHIEPNALVFKRDDLPSLDAPDLYTWGAYDGSGEPIRLTFRDYYNQFIYSKPFYEAPQIGYDQILGQGNAEPNIAERFPGSHTADYYFSGFDPQYAGIDWQSLILVLENDNGFWYVSAIVHSQWTI